MDETFWTRFLGSHSDNRKSKIQNRKWAGIVAIALTFVFGGAVATAQQPKKVPRIGYLPGFSSGTTVDEFRQGLRDLGYIEEKNVLVE